MAKDDKRLKRCANEGCIIHRNKRKFYAEDIYCTVCQEKLVYMCKRCGEAFESQGVDDLYCDRCDQFFAERKQKAVDVAKRTAGVVKAGADLVAVVAPMKAVKNLPKVGKVVAKAKPVADVVGKMGK